MKYTLPIYIVAPFPSFAPVGVFAYVFVDVFVDVLVAAFVDENKIGHYMRLVGDIRAKRETAFPIG